MSDAGHRICLVVGEYLPDSGGTAAAAARLVRFLTSGDNTVHVFAPVTRPPLQGASQAAPVTDDRTVIHRVPRGADSLANLQAAISRVDDEQPFDLFHGFFFRMAHPCLAVARRGDRPVIASFRGLDAQWLKTTLNELDLAILEQATWITSVSTDALLAADALADISDRSSFIPNSIEPGAAAVWRLTPENRGVVGTVSTFREKKDIPLLVQAFGRLPAAMQRKLLLVGDFEGPEAVSVHARTHRVIGRYQAGDKVEITGWVERARVPEYLSRLNVFVNASKHEGLPNALLEAAAVGVPLVATAVDGTKDIFRDGESALFVPPGDANALTAAIVRVLSEPGLAERLSAGARRVAASLAPHVERRAWLELYDRLLAHGHGHGNDAASNGHGHRQTTAWSHGTSNGANGKANGAAEAATGAAVRVKRAVTYDRGFYQFRRDRARQSAEVVIPMVIDLIHPASIADIGCGTGSWLAVAKVQGVAEVLGVDLEAVPRDLLEIASEEFVTRDLCAPIDLGRRFDLVFALEVAEHIPAESADSFVESLTRLAPAVLFSAAIPHEGGRGHVNEQWPQYWVDRFRRHDYAAIDCLRIPLWDDPRVLQHYAQNMMLFVSRERMDDYPDIRSLSRHSQACPEHPLSLVHPSIYLGLVRRLASLFPGSRF